jgi:aminoglycoside 9-adenylyltransferase
MTDTVAIPREAQQTADIAQELFVDRLAGVYLYGSAVAGGLQERSDVDVLVVMENRLTDPIRQRFLNRIMAVSGPLGNAQGVRPLEVTVVHLGELIPWKHPPRMELQYGEWLRTRIEKGWWPQSEQHADLTILLYQVREKSVALYGPDAKELLPEIPWQDVKWAIGDSWPELVANLKGDERNVLLTLARMWQTAALGIITPKDAAADWAMPQMPEAYGALLKMAAQGYRGESRDEWAEHPSTLDEMVKFMVEAIRACLEE